MSETLVEDNSSGIRRRRIITCPHCEQELVVHLRTEIERVVAGSTVDRFTPSDWREVMPANEVEIVDQAVESGIFQPFRATVDFVKQGESPRSMERFFVTFLKTAKQKMVPGFAINIFSKRHNERLEFWAAQGIMAVAAAGGRLLEFVPSRLVSGESVRSVAGGNKLGLKTTATPDELSDWIRTRYGYVAGTGAMFKALRVKCIGEFEIPDLPRRKA